MTLKTALITGGATGIGKATAKKLISQGVNVVISGRREELASGAIADIESVAINGAIVKFIRNDVTDETAIQQMIAQVVSEFGRLDMAVNNAGVYNEAATLDQSDTKKFKALLQRALTL